MLKDVRIVRRVVQISLVLAILLAVWGQAYAVEQESVVSDPCAGTSSFLAILVSFADITLFSLDP